MPLLADVRTLFDEQGLPKKPEDWPQEIAAAVHSIRIIARDRPGGTTETSYDLRLLDRNRTLELLGKHLGLFEERLNVNHEVALLPHMSEDEVMERLLAKRAQRARLARDVTPQDGVVYLERQG